ncbi:MAG: putative 4-hydroxybenzoate polyprenyltransferase, partial [Candidatus Thermoplasmatota archaeon]|nr:putative 4-hydroxybenzoate polyprenyltransferase [Candidatus Thermoplasmatota archaeon]
VIAAHGLYPVIKFLLITVAAISARTAAMSINRIQGLKYDLKNPRKKDWPLVTGEITMKNAILFTVISAVIFEVSAYLLNWLVFLLSPIVLFLFLTDPLLKRVTSWRHVYMGLTIGVGTLGGYLAVVPSFPTSPVIYLVFLASSLWIAGFDMIYVIPDTEYDRANGLKTVMSKFSLRKGLFLSSMTHVITGVLFVFIYFYIMSTAYLVALALILSLMALQHVILDPGNPKSVKASFLGANSFIGLIFLLGVAFA